MEIGNGMEMRKSDFSDENDWELKNTGNLHYVVDGL